MRFERYFQFTDTDGQPLAFGEDWGVYAYPDGQNQIWFETRQVVRHLTVCLNHPAIVDLVSQIPDAIGPVDLFVTYLYGARSDKSASGTRSVCNVAVQIRAMLGQVSCGRDLQILMPHDGVKNAADFLGLSRIDDYDGIIFPDASAKSRTAWRSTHHKEEIIFEKVRYQQTGDIIDYKPLTAPTGNRYLVADDLCDGGATFIKIAEALPDCSLDLSVVHGVFSGGALDRLSNAGYGQIWTTNSYVQHDVDDEANILQRCRVQNVW